jgi:serine/threonine protein kinase
VTVHESGFVYGDLKPENIVITATRHVKLADFGACRPVTADAKSILIQSRDALTNMRSGDWKGPIDDLVDIRLSDSDILNSSTFEGTEAYMAPEGDSHCAPTVLSDAWALGLVTYFLVKARLPPWVGGSTKGLERFDLRNLIMTDLSESFSSPTLIDFLAALLVPDPEDRLSVEEIMTHVWFADVQEIRGLYNRDLPNEHLGDAMEESVGSSSSGWEKRQLSKIWSAQPVDYQLGGSSNGGTFSMSPIVETDIERNTPFG